MCCKSPCSVIRCNGCPATDWSAFTWRWLAPAAVGVSQEAGSDIERAFGAKDESMIYPGTCRCTWIVDGGDTGKDTAGTYQPIDTSYPIPSIGALEYRRSENRYVWKITLSRFDYGWNWTVLDTRYYGLGWGWSADWAEDDCGNAAGNPYWGGFGGFGFNGWGWGYGAAAGTGITYGQTGYVTVATYSLQAGDTMSCTGGTVRFFLDAQPDDPDFDPAAWPAFVDIARVAK